MKPVVIDLCCGLWGWGRAFVAEGYRVIGFDVTRVGAVPDGCELVLQDIRTIDGYRLRDLRPTLIVASAPCQEFTRHMMPWTRKRNPPPPDLSIVEACFRIAGEAGCPIVMENVREAQKWIGKASAHFGSRYLWGDIPAILPEAPRSRKEHMSSTAVAQRSEIPKELAEWIAQCFKPTTKERIENT